MDDINPSELLGNAFLDVSANDIRALAERANLRTVPAGEFICQEGDTGSTLFVLGGGEVDIIVHAEDHQDILVDTLRDLTYFGEMALLGETTRMATVRARTPCTLLEIDQADFIAVARSNPNLLRTLLRQIIGHLRRNDQAVIKELNVKNAALEKAYADLAEQEKLRTQFIATLSHELRTPLTSIKGFLGLINQGAIDGESLEVALDSITRNVETMVGLTNDLLILYEMHPAAPEYSYFPVADVLIESLNAARDVLNGEAPAVRLDIAPDIPDIYADKRALVLAVRALIENAFKFNPDDAPVSIRASAVDKSQIAIAVTDEGVGIPAEELERVFEPFVRVESEGSSHLFPGLGVGLTIARFVVNRHHGRIYVDSQLGKGSTFSIILPQITREVPTA